ncbi:hypothetical protein QNM99_06470 [Pseudomonas sp. PCH446]
MHGESHHRGDSPDAASHATLERLIASLKPHLQGERHTACWFVINGVDTSTPCPWTSRRSSKTN